MSHSHLRIEDIKIPLSWGHISGQVFSNAKLTSKANSQPILCLHGYLDNSNSFKPMASEICRSQDYYLIALDLPGHGLSSHLPRGIPYTFKIMLQSVRKCVMHLELKNFVFMCHSYGVSLSYFYQTIFPGEVKANVSLDWIFSFPYTLTHKFTSYIKEGIDAYIEHEKQEESEERLKAISMRSKLTREKAVEILLKANNHLVRKLRDAK